MRLERKYTIASVTSNKSLHPTAFGGAAGDIRRVWHNNQRIDNEKVFMTAKKSNKALDLHGFSPVHYSQQVLNH